MKGNCNFSLTNPIFYTITFNPKIHSMSKQLTIESGHTTYCKNLFPIAYLYYLQNKQVNIRRKMQDARCKMTTNNVLCANQYVLLQTTTY